MNGGNPTSSPIRPQVGRIPVRDVARIANWRGSAFDFGKNKSPDGAIEY